MDEKIENELDSTCGVSDEELDRRFKEAIRLEIEIKRPYLEYPDGRREYA